MFAKGPAPGASPKTDALLLLPEGTVCSVMTAAGITGYVITLPDDRQIASAGNASRSWEKALAWAQARAAEDEQRNRFISATSA